jgi:hypothetical protein
MFLDCFNREIKVGDVLANGQRQSTHGGITVGVVTGFTSATILVNTLHVKTVYHAPAGDAERSYYERSYSRENEEPLGYYWRKGCYREPKNCFITGQSEAELVEGIETMLHIEEIEDPRIAQNREWKQKWAEYEAQRKEREAQEAEQEGQQSPLQSALAEISAISQKYGEYD